MVSIRQIDDNVMKKKIFQARIELASYEPWGRAGGGAPNPHGIRFSDLRAVGIYPEDELKVKLPYAFIHILYQALIIVIVACE